MSSVDCGKTDSDTSMIMGEVAAASSAEVQDGGLHKLLHLVVSTLFNRDVHSSSFMAVGSRPWLTVA